MKYLALVDAISATTSRRDGDTYNSRFTKRFSFDKSTQTGISSEFFLGVTTIGAHHSVGFVTGAMILCCCHCLSFRSRRSSYTKGALRGTLVQRVLSYLPCVYQKFHLAWYIHFCRKTVRNVILISPELPDSQGWMALVQYTTH